VQALVDIALPRDAQIAGRYLELERTRRALQIDSLWFASIDQEVELRNHTSIAVPEPVAVWARGGHLAVRSRNREPAVVLEDGALRGQQVGQDVRAWSGEVCAAASKAGLEPTE